MSLVCETTSPPSVPVTVRTGFGGNRFHFAKDFMDRNADCPCVKAPCGMVDNEADELCTLHGSLFAGTMRSRHHETDCPVRFG